MIGGALIAIFVSGYGIGFLFGERRTTDRLTPLIDPSGQQANASWEQRTLDRLTDQLDLDPAQSGKIAAEIRATSGDIGKIRPNAIRESQQVLLDLHERIEAHLDQRQREVLESDKNALERVLQ